MSGKSTEKYKNFLTNIKNLNNPRFIYVLGFLWADAHLEIRPRTCSIKLEIVKEDFDIIEECITSTGEWNISERQRYDRRTQKWNKPLKIARVYPQEIVNWFKLYDYDIKSNVEPIKILSVIPKDLQFYWFRGYFDGDGYVGEHKASITSGKNQQWRFIQDILEANDIESSISATAHFSALLFTNRINLLKLFKYLYPSGYDFGLKRKYDKFVDIESYLNRVYDSLKEKEPFICVSKKGYYIFSFSRKNLKKQKSFSSKEEAIAYRDKFLAEHNITNYNITGNRLLKSSVLQT